jgi:hypothetical protein
MDPQVRIRIHTKMLWIRNTAIWTLLFVELEKSVIIDHLQLVVILGIIKAQSLLISLLLGQKLKQA